MHPIYRLSSGNRGKNVGYGSAKETLESFQRLSGANVVFIDESGSDGDSKLRLEIVQDDGKVKTYVGWKAVKWAAYDFKRKQERFIETSNPQPSFN